MSPLHSCSICSSTLAEGEGLTLDVASTGSSRRIGGYCGVRCRDAARALLALGALEVGASPERQARRDQVTHALLVKWRRGEGPEPAAVLAAAQRALLG
ncbi:MAG: hypothetical protein ACXVRV_13875 [Gaiellaceae bacterium]